MIFGFVYGRTEDFRSTQSSQPNWSTRSGQVKTIWVKGFIPCLVCNFFLLRVFCFKDVFGKHLLIKPFLSCFIKKNMGVCRTKPKKIIILRVLISFLYATSLVSRISKKSIRVLSSRNSRWWLPNQTKNHSRTPPVKSRRGVALSRIRVGQVFCYLIILSLSIRFCDDICSYIYIYIYINYLTE
jgi:hypothetical protein